MKDILKISIGIPAYNESANIQALLKSLLQQTGDNFEIAEIIVVSDGSTDKTSAQVLAVRSKKIKLLAEKTRLGKSTRINQIIRIFKGNTLFLMDADISIKDKFLLSEIVKSGMIEKSGLIGITAIPNKPNNFFERIMMSGNTATYTLGKKWNNGNNYLLFKGCFLVLSRKFAKSVQMPKEIVNNDAFLYFAAISKGLLPTYIKEAVVYFKSPQNLTDHQLQSGRFRTSRKEMQKYFKFDLSPEYNIPKSVLISAAISCFLANPLYFLCYVIINSISKNTRNDNVNALWNIASSTKK